MSEKLYFVCEQFMGNNVLFSAVLEKTESARAGIKKTSYYFKDVCTKSGDVVKQYLIPSLTIDDQEEIEKLASGEYIAFTAEVDLNSIRLIP